MRGQSSNTTTTTARRRRRGRWLAATAVLIGVLVLGDIPGAGSQQGCGGLEGKVVATNNLAISRAKVALLPAEGGDALVTGETDANGDFCLSRPPGNYRLQVELAHADYGLTIATEPSGSDTSIYEADNPPAIQTVSARLQVTAADFGAPIQTVVGGGAEPGNFPDAHLNFVSNVPNQRNKDLRDAGQIYFYSVEFLDWWHTAFGFSPTSSPLSAKPVTVVTDNSHPTQSAAEGSTFYDPKNARVMISTRDTNSSLRPSFSTLGKPTEGPQNMEWHELTHHLQTLDGVRAKTDPLREDSTNHAGLANPNTADSVLEGWAAFLPTVAAAENASQLVDASPVYAQFGSLESNLKKARSKDPDGSNGETEEDIAFAALMWDLYDGATCPAGCDTAAGLVSSSALPPADDGYVVVQYTDEISIPLQTLIGALDVPDLDGEPDVTVAGFHQALMNLPDSVLPGPLKTPSIDLDKDGNPDISKLDVPFLMHGFHPCVDTFCSFQVGTPVGRTDQGSFFSERRAIPRRIGASINVVNSSDVDDTVDITVVDDVGTQVYSFTVPAGTAADVPMDMPASYLLPVAPGDQPPPCGDEHEGRIAVSIADGQGGQTAFDSCEYDVFIGDSEGQSALSHLVGDVSLRFRVELVDAPGPGVITIGEGFTFDQVVTALTNGGFSASLPGGSSLAIDGTIKLYIPALESISPLRVPGATITVDTATRTVGLFGQIVYADVVFDLDLSATWADDTDQGAAFDIGIAVSGAGGEPLITAAQAISLLTDLVDPAGTLTVDASVLPDDLALESLGAHFVWEDGTVGFDGTAAVTVGGVRATALLSADKSPGSDAQFLLGVRFDNATDPSADTITLDGFLGGDLGDLAASVELPEFALATVIPEPATPLTNADLRPEQQAFFGPAGLPDGLELDASLSIAASLSLDVLGPDVRNVFDYAPGTTVDLYGSLGFTLTDFDSGLFQLGDIDLRAELPPLGPDNQLVPWLTVDRLAATFAYDAAASEVTVGFEADASVEIADDSQPGGSIDLGFTVGVGVSATTTPANQTILTVSLQGETAPGTSWPHPYGLDWLDLDAVGLGVEVVVEGTDVSVSGGITAEFALGGKDFRVTVAFDTADEPEATITVALEDTISLTEVLSLFGTFDLPSDFDNLTVGPVTVTARVGPSPSLAVNATGSILGLDMNLLFMIEDGGATPSIVFGARSDAVTFTQLFGADPLGLGALPPIGIVGSSSPIDASQATLGAEAVEFFAPLYGCTGPSDGCTFTVDLDAGIHIISTVPVPGEGIEDDGVTDLADIVKLVWVDPDAGLFFRASGPLPIGGSIDPTALSIELALGIDPPDDVRQEFPWFNSANLSISASLEDLSVSIGGELTVKLGREAQTTQSACDLVGASWIESYPGSGMLSCYDVLDLSLRAGVSLSGPPTLTFTGSLETDGWQPFEWLRIDQATLQVGVEFAGSPVFTFGFLAQGALFDKDFLGSAVVGFRVLPNPPFVVPEPKGVHLASQAGLELADVVKLYDVLREGGAAVAQELGFVPPELDLDLSALPNISLRNLELMLGIGNFPELCIEPGLVIGGELYINAEPLTVAPPAPPGDCNDIPPFADPLACANNPECFAAGLIQVTLDGLIFSGSVGGIDLGLVACDDSIFDFRLTPAQQSFMVSGGCDLRDFVGGTLASGDLELSIGLDGMSFVGDFQLFPEPPPPGFRILIEGEAAFDLASIDFTDPSVLAALDFYLHARLETEFGARTTDAVGPALDNLRVAAQIIDELIAQLVANGGDPIAVVVDLPDTLDDLGLETPQWVTDFSAGVGELRDTLETYGRGFPAIDDALGGFDFEFQGIPGFDTDIGCFSLPPLPGFVVAGECYSIPPGTIHVPGICDFSVGIPCSLAELVTAVEDLLKPALADVPGVPDDLSLTALVDTFEAPGPLFALTCVDFVIDTLDEADSTVELRVASVAFGKTINLELIWDLTADPLDEAGRLVEAIMAQLFGPERPNTCQELGTTSVGRPIGSTGSATPSLGFDLLVSPATVTENDTVTVDVDFDTPPAGTVDVTIDWGDGSSETVPMSATDHQATHTYLDDAPSGTSQDSYVVAVTANARSNSELVTVNNAAPSGLTLSTSTASEGSPTTLSGSFVDPGSLDEHTVRIDWGDGSPATEVVLPVGDRTFSADHIYLDDDPTGTSSDDYLVKVTVKDDDRGRGSTQATLTVENVAPSGVSVTPGTVVRENDVVAYDFEFTDPGKDTHQVRVDWGDGSPTQYVFMKDGQRSFTLNHRFLDDNPSGTPVDTYDVKVTVVDDDTGSITLDQPVAVSNVVPDAETPTPPEPVQYSDPVDDVAIVVTDVVGDPLTATAKWSVDGGTEVAGLPGAWALTDSGCTTNQDDANLQTCEWTLGGITDVAPGDYVVSITIEDDDTGRTVVAVPITVLQEDARAYYIGPLFAATTDANDNTAVVELRATIQDITAAVGDPDYDPDPGDILNATVRFVDREDGDATLCTATLGLTFAGDHSLATATCDWTADIGQNDALPFVVGVIVDGYYTRNDTNDDAIVTVARPIDDFITGGGYLTLTEESAGVYEGDDGSHANFGMNVKFNKKGTNLQGRVTIIVRADGRVYRIKTNSLTSLGVVEVADGVGVAEFEAKANIVDVTDQDAPVSLGGNLVFQMRMTDNGEPGDTDEIGFSLWDKNGELLFSSNWNGTQTTEQTLGGGNVVVHD